jgi:Mitochondrial carrier protein
MDAFRKIYKNEGIPGFITGLGPRLVRKPLANALTFTFFEIINKNFRSKE